jgi:hypothetical protein
MNVSQTGKRTRPLRLALRKLNSNGPTAQKDDGARARRSSRSRDCDPFRARSAPVEYHPMMTREQRIDYEILDFTLNATTGAHGYATTVPKFLNRLRELFPDVAAREFTDACKRLFKQDALHLQALDNDSAPSSTTTTGATM